MKKTIFIFTTILVFTISSCVTTKEFYRPFNEEMLVGREPGNEVFIITTNGSKVSGHNMTSHSSVFHGDKSKDWHAIDGEKITDDKISVIQTEKSYTAWYKFPDKSTRVISRLRYGKISLYTYVELAALTGIDNQRDARGDYHMYVFEKEKGKLGLLSFKSFSDAIADNPAALQRLKELYSNSNIPKHNEKGNLKNLLEVVELYNKG